MALRSILEVCDREMVYKLGGMICEPWWWQTSARKQLSATLEDILAAPSARRWKSGRRGKVKRGREVVDSDTGSNGYRYAGTETGDARVTK